MRGGHRGGGVGRSGRVRRRDQRWLFSVRVSGWREGGSDLGLVGLLVEFAKEFKAGEMGFSGLGGDGKKVLGPVVAFVKVNGVCVSQTTSSAGGFVEPWECTGVFV